VGIASYHVDRLRGVDPTIIEYKQAE
jgi:hypothetical protein